MLMPRRVGRNLFVYDVPDTATAAALANHLKGQGFKVTLNAPDAVGQPLKVTAMVCRHTMREASIIRFILHPAYEYRIGLAKALRDPAYRTIAAQNY